MSILRLIVLNSLRRSRSAESDSIRGCMWYGVCVEDEERILGGG